VSTSKQGETLQSCSVHHRETECICLFEMRPTMSAVTGQKTQLWIKCLCYVEPVAKCDTAVEALVK